MVDFDIGWGWGGPGTNSPQILRDDYSQVLGTQKLCVFFWLCGGLAPQTNAMLFKSQLYLYLWYDIYLICVLYIYTCIWYICYLFLAFALCIFSNFLYLYILHGSFANDMYTAGFCFLFRLIIWLLAGIFSHSYWMLTVIIWVDCLIWACCLFYLFLCLASFFLASLLFFHIISSFLSWFWI